MKLEQLEVTNREKLEPGTVKAISRYERLICELGKHALPEHLTAEINALTLNLQDITEEKHLNKQVRKSTESAINRAREKAGLVTKGYNQALWMPVGMAAFGVPFGVAFGLLLDNLALMAVGLPLGLPIGLAVGQSMDKKAEKAGKVLFIDC